jgi:mycothiol S-conjugate amidase
MGVDHVWLGYHDSGLPDAEKDEHVRPGTFATVPVETSAENLVRIVRRFRPHVMITYDENGGYPHPDHIRTHDVSMAAWRDAGDPTSYPDAGTPWTMSKLYFERTMNPARFKAVYAAMSERTPDDPAVAQLGEFMERFADRPDLSTTHVDVSAYFDARDAALRAHASQVPTDSAFFFWPNDLLASIWPTEDFQLVATRVPATVPEDDLFAGVVEDTEPGADELPIEGDLPAAVAQSASASSGASPAEQAAEAELESEQKVQQS